MVGSRRREAGPLAEVSRYFLRLGAIAFGGPAAHIAIMRRELVQQRGWMSDDEFVDLMGAANLIPGPNSTELTMHLGKARAGWWGLWIGGLAFIAPAVAITLVFAWIYVEYGDRPAVEGILVGIQPVILAVIIQAIWGLRGAAVKSVLTVVIALVVAVLALAGVNEIVLLLGAGLVVFAWRVGRRAVRLTAVVPPLLPSLPALVTAASAPTAGGIFLGFLKIGTFLYGSGYVLVSFMESEFVDKRGWMSEQQLLDAVAVGQVTPGPLFSSATFAGYVMDSWAGAAAATVGIFLPAFFFVAITAPLVPRIRSTVWAAGFLDGVNAAAIALIAVTAYSLASETLTTAFTAALFAISAAVLLRFNLNTAWFVLAGAVAGLVHEFLV